MIVDTTLLRCGADFSRSAGSICRDGADKFASAQAGSSIFGDFDAATSFQRAIVATRDSQAAAMHVHRAALDSLAEKSNIAAAVFAAQDETSGDSIRSASV
jgi:hypothetical protein